MNQVTLKKYVGTHGQTETARRAGLSQGAIWQMLKNDRCIFVIAGDGNEITLEERRTVPRRESS